MKTLTELTLCHVRPWRSAGVHTSSAFREAQSRRQTQALERRGARASVPGTGCTEEGAAELELREGPSLPKGDKGVLASGEPDF